MDLSQVQNQVFCHFLEFGSYVFLEIESKDSLRQCLTSNRGKTHEKKFGAQVWVKWTKIGLKISFFFVIFSSLVHQISFKLHKMIGWNYCLTTSRGKTHKKHFGDPKLGPELVFLPFSQVFSSLHDQFSLILHRIAAWENV